MHSFFLSYSSNDDPQFVNDFFNTLRQQLQIVHGANRLEPGFLAPINVEPADNWRQTVPRALNASHVLVCLCSPNYFGSEYCGKELEVFLERRRLYSKSTGGGEAPACILPVSCLPQPWGQEIPQGLPGHFQWKKLERRSAPEIEGLYQEYLYKDRNLPQWFMHTLAQRISTLLGKNTGPYELPSLPEQPHIDATENAFRPLELPLPDMDSVKASGPRSVTFVYPDIPREKWPWPAPQNCAVVRAAGVAKSRELSIQGIGFQNLADTGDRIRKAQNEDNIVIAVLIGAATGEASFAPPFDLPREGVATIVVCDSVGDKNRIERSLPTALRRSGWCRLVFTQDDLDKCVAESIGKLQIQSKPRRTIDRDTEYPTKPS